MGAPTDIHAMTQGARLYIAQVESGNSRSSGSPPYKLTLRKFEKPMPTRGGALVDAGNMQLMEATRDPNLFLHSVAPMRKRTRSMSTLHSDGGGKDESGGNAGRYVMTDTPPQKQLDVIEIALACNPTLLSVYHGLAAGGKCRLSFCSSRNLTYRGMMETSIADQFGSLADNGQVNRAGLTIRFVPACDSPGSNAKLSRQDAWRGKMWLKREAPNSISRLVPFTAGASIEGEAYILGAAIVTLVIELDGQPLPSPNSDTQRRSTTIEPLGPRPELQPVWLDYPDRMEITDLVSQFMRDPIGLQKACADQAKTLQLLPYKYQRSCRSLLKFQAETLLPIQKAFIGFGLGETTLKIASTVAISQAKETAKQRDAIGQEELTHLFWAHALATGGQKPPLVRL